ncbi:D-alanine--D-alanine ligase [Ruminococcaceae bacterium OttesenSCG-928-A16]|nr:D-alanine--D-alanine ligase [Ruminococcaceae bacterium OttesenSCG-928-A16]
MKQTVAVIFGGASSEYEVSLQSATAVIKAINRQKYNVMQVGIAQNGQWLLYEGEPEKIANDSWQQTNLCTPVVFSANTNDHGLWVLQQQSAIKSTMIKCQIDIALPILHGKNGEDGAVQGLLQLSGIPFSGCGVLASALCMDKDFANRLATAAGIPCAISRAFTHTGPVTGALCNQIEQAMQGVSLPWYVKPAAEGSSFGITCVHTLQQLHSAVEAALQYGSKFVVEQGIAGREVGCAVLGEENALASVPDMILLQQDTFDFYEKYHLDTAQIKVPAPVSGATKTEIQTLALRLYNLFGCTGFARVDMFLQQDGTLVFNEINTIPGFTAHSRYPNMMQQTGLPFEELVERVLKGACSR